MSILPFIVLGCAVIAATASEVRETRFIPAEEAVQASAGDDRFVYAIASTVAAKYDRQTGKRIAFSTGEATHLNSGFVFEGKLYCAFELSEETRA